MIVIGVSSALVIIVIIIIIVALCLAKKRKDRKSNPLIEEMQDTTANTKSNTEINSQSVIKAIP